MDHAAHLLESLADRELLHFLQVAGRGGDHISTGASSATAVTAACRLGLAQVHGEVRLGEHVGLILAHPSLAASSRVLELLRAFAAHCGGAQVVWIEGGAAAPVPSADGAHLLQEAASGQEASPTPEQLSGAAAAAARAAEEEEAEAQVALALRQSAEEEEQRRQAVFEKELGLIWAEEWQEDEEAPVELFVHSPNGHLSRTGAYVLVASARPNGMPLWRQRDGHHWLYRGKNGKWCIGGRDVEARCFDCSAAHLYCEDGHLFPHEASVGKWARWDGSKFLVDPSILVTTTEISGSKTATRAMARPMLGREEDAMSPPSHASENEDTPVICGCLGSTTGE